MRLPSKGMSMFAMAGSLMARSLARPAAGVLRRRARRLLLPLWVYAAIMLSLLTAAGIPTKSITNQTMEWGRFGRRFTGGFRFNF